MFLPNEIQLLIIRNLSLTDLKAYRLVDKQCNHVCRPRLWERIEIPHDVEELERLVEAGNGFTWKDCNTAATWRHDSTEFLAIPPVVRWLGIVFAVSDDVMELQAKAVALLAPALSLSEITFSQLGVYRYRHQHSLIEKEHQKLGNARYNTAKSKLFSTIGHALRARPDTKVYVQFSSRTAMANITSFDALAYEWPSRIRTYEAVIEDTEWNNPGPSFILSRLENLERLKIHFVSTFQYHQDPDFTIPQSVTDLNITGPLMDNDLIHTDYIPSAFLEILPHRLTKLTLEAEVIVFSDLDNIAQLPNLISLTLIANVFYPSPDMVDVGVEPIPNYFKSRNLKNLAICFADPEPQGPYVSSILRSCPNLAKLCLLWFIPGDIHILPEFCRNIQILDLHHPHPLYTPEREQVFSDMFRNDIWRLSKLNSISIISLGPIQVETMSLIRCAVHCPYLLGVMMSEGDPEAMQADLPNQEQFFRRNKFQNDISGPIKNWPEHLTFGGRNCRLYMDRVRWKFADLSPDDQALLLDD